MASCRIWSTVGFVLGIVAGVCAGTGTGLSDVLGNGDMTGEVLKTLRALQPTGQQALRSTHRPTEHRSIKQDQLMTYIEQYTGQTPKTVHKPSVNFMFNVFEHLLQGEEMSTILGHTDERMRNKLASLDTLRSYTPTIMNGNYMFRVPGIPNHEHVKVAELRFLDNHPCRRRHRITLRVQKDGNTLVKEKVYFSSATKSHTFTLGSLSVINHYKGNVTVKMTVRKRDLKKNKDTEENLPILVVYSTDQGFLKSALKSLTSNTNRENAVMESTQRQKRAASSQMTSRKKGRKRRKDRWRNNVSETEQCKMLGFKVDFDVIGWGPWIIHPKTYNARVCYGQCPSPISSEYSPTNHAMLQSLMRLKRPLSGPEPCCVPTKLRPLSMLYFEYDDIVVRHHQDMIVDECGCR